MPSPVESAGSGAQKSLLAAFKESMKGGNPEKTSAGFQTKENDIKKTSSQTPPSNSTSKIDFKA